MKANAIIFDKDGTLLDFDAFWVAVSVKAMESVIVRFGVCDNPMGEIMEAFGVTDGVTDVNGVLCRGTYGQMGEIVYEIFSKHGCTADCDEVTNAVIEAYETSSAAGVVKPTCPELRETLAELKNRGIKLAVVTTDNVEITEICLKKLGIYELFDKIYTDDGVYPTKPDPFCADDFRKNFGVPKEQTVMVGDTMTDVKFAKNAGISIIAVAKNAENHAVLSPYADRVVSSIAELSGIIE